MNRNIVYPGALPLETDLLATEKNAMIGLGQLAQAMVGTSPVIYGLDITPDSPASLNVICRPGQAYVYAVVDATDYSSIPADTTHGIVKQAIVLDNTTLSCPAPGIAGQSINYLVQVAFEEVDEDPVLLPYYNSSNPSQPYAGPNNNGVSQNTVRACNAVVTVKAGAAATTGTQTTPSPDAGNAGVAVVTVAYGQTQINDGNITDYYDSPRLPFNDGLLWKLRNSIYTKSIAGGGNIVLTDAEAANPIRVLTGALTANAHIVLPDISGQWIIINNSTGAYTTYFTTVASGTDCSVDQTTTSVVVSTGEASVTAVSGSGTGVSFVTKTEFTATAGQTSFSHTYTPGSIFLVTRNGAAVGYTATSGTAVVLDAAASLNDEVVLFEGAVTVVTPSIPSATETTEGIAEIATQSEADTGSDDQKIVTPLKLSTRMQQVLHVRDEKTSGTPGGTFTNGAWRTRTLNTVVKNNITGASMASDQITLPVGTYRVEAYAPAWSVYAHTAKLRNITDSTDEIIGTPCHDGEGGITLVSRVIGILTVTGSSKVFELQHRCVNTEATSGLGKDAGLGVVEVYSEVIITKL